MQSIKKKWKNKTTEPITITLREIVDELHPVTLIDRNTGKSTVLSPTKITVQKPDEDAYHEMISDKNNSHFIKDLVAEGKGVVIAIDRREKK